MRILITAGDKKIKLIFPLFIAKWALPFVNYEEINLLKPLIKKSYKVLKKYIKENGHFVLLEVESSDSSVKIEV